MSRWKRIARKNGLFLAIFVLAGTVLTANLAEGGVREKLSPRLRAVLQSARAGSLAKQGQERILVPLFIRKQEGVSVRQAVEAVGGSVGTEIGEWATADVPLSSVTDLAGLEVVRYLELSPTVEPCLDSSRVRTGADRVQRGDPPLARAYTGAGVVIGIVDTGIDIHHPDFKNADGSSRILAIWDQTVPGKFPSGFFYGGEWTRQEIESSLCNEKDTDGHGTHVAGIAAGNGSANARYTGIAPGADLVIVKTDFSLSHVVDAVNYIFQKAGNRPAVANLSLSSQQGPHDDSSTPEKMLDQLVQAGKVVVAAASNEGNRTIHAGFEVSAGKVYGTKFAVHSTTPEAIELDVWYPSTGSLDFAIGALDASGAWLDQSVWVTPGQSSPTQPSG